MIHKYATTPDVYQALTRELADAWTAPGPSDLIGMLAHIEKHAAAVEIVKVDAISPEHAAHIELALWDLNYFAMMCGTAHGRWYVETNAPKNVYEKVSAEFVPRFIPQE